MKKTWLILIITLVVALTFTVTLSFKGEKVYKNTLINCIHEMKYQGYSNNMIKKVMTPVATDMGMMLRVKKTYGDKFNVKIQKMEASLGNYLRHYCPKTIQVLWK